MDYVIQVEGLSFSYRDNKVLEDVSFSVKEGSFVSILGPNGSGKSTLLKLITSVAKAQSGTVKVAGKNISIMSKKDLAQILSVVPQNTALEFDFKVFDIVMMGRYPFINKLRGETTEDIEIVKSSMSYTNTLHLSERSFNELSGGERQRVILAQALAQKPGILVLDEPISHLDLQHQVELLNLIRKMCVDNGLTVVSVLHDLNMAATYSDHIIMLKDKSIRYSGAPIEVLTSQSIKEVFNADVYVSRSSLGQKPYIYTLTKPHIESKGTRVHVICGGGSGSEILKELYLSGYELSTGVLAIGDQDWKIAKELEINIAEEIPFVSIAVEAYTANLELAKTADTILLTGLYFGRANLRNLELLLEKPLSGKRVLILDDETFSNRDYTDGMAAALYERIKESPRVELVDKNELLDKLARQVDYEALNN